MDPRLSQKIERIFADRAVNKQHALQAGFGNMPRFVTEYLLAQARLKDGAIGIDKVRERIQKFSVDADRKNSFISRLMLEGQARLIGHLEVEPKPERNEHIARMMQLGDRELRIEDKLLSQFPELLYGGLWGTVILRYDTSPAKPRILVEEFTPYQLTKLNLHEFREARQHFSLDEWIELLLTSAGYRPEAFPTRRHRILALCRLVPLVQPSVNLIEMGPRGTGKSYLLRNVSSRAFLLAGARATPASLLYDLSRRQVGIVGRKKVVVFDEVGATSFPDKSLVAALKEYMVSGNITRGGHSTYADCSFVFAGNLDLDPAGRLPNSKYQHYFECLPTELRDSAIADRIHGYIPGWELPKISDTVLADGVGLVSDYFGEILCQLRQDPAFPEYVSKNLSLNNATIRDKISIERVSTGLLKMLFPDRKFESAGQELAFRVAVELRQRVHEQLTKMAPGEFQPKRLEFAKMLDHEAPDLLERNALHEQDVAANERLLVGKTTILFVSSRGGGDVGFVECAHVEGSGLSITGLRGTVLDQAVRAAYDALLHLGRELGLSPEHLRSRKMSVHLVNVDEPKDGPSAGLAFALAMLSSATKRPIRKAFAVTGELSVHGNVNAVGGIAEKLAAALHHGRTTIAIPAANGAELARLPDLRRQLNIHPVQTLAEAVSLALVDAPLDETLARSSDVDGGESTAA